MKVLFVLENYFPNIGGVETLFKTLVESLVKAGHECIVITARLNREDPYREIKPGLTIIRLSVASRYLFTAQAIWPVLRHLRGVDLVQTTSYNAALPAFIAARLGRKKVVVTFHEAWGQLWFQLPFMSRFSKWAHYLFEQLLLRLPFDRFIAVSESTAKRLAEEGVAEKRITRINNGIDYAEFDDEAAWVAKPPGFIYTYFGRLGISKGLDLLLPAAEKVRAQVPDTHLELVVSKVPEKLLRWLQQEIRDRELEEYAVLRHHLSFEALKQLIRISDCVVIPSYSEGFCFAAVETMALGTPIISSGRGALQEVVGGRYLELESLTASDLEAAMLRAYRGDWEERPDRKFELQDTIEAYLRVYAEL